MFTVSKLARMSQKEGGEIQFDGDVGKIQINQESGTSAVFDMGVEDAKKLMKLAENIDAGGAVFSIMKELEIERGRFFGGRGPMQPGQQPGLKFNNQVRNAGPGGMMMPQGGPGGPMMQQQHQQQPRGEMAEWPRDQAELSKATIKKGTKE